MRRVLGVLFVLCLFAAPLGAAPSSAAPGAGGFASDNLEWVKFFPLHTDSAGGALVGNYFYITTERDLVIYDISDPINPVEVGRALLVPPGDFYFPEEDPETNGKILLIGNGGSLQVFDVEDKTNPVVIGTVAGGDEHTISCVLDCKWAYGSEGVIVDLRDPTKPKIAGNWKEKTPVEQTHDVTEVSPGIIVTSSQPMVVLDARKDPAKPKVIAVAASKDQRFNHSNLWPHNGTDKYLLVGGESSGPQCSEDASASFMTWDTTNWRKTGTFKMVDEHKLKNGLPTDGDAPTEQFCVHWFTTHPDYRNGGLVAIAWYEHGTRILRISDKGKISDEGWFIPFAGSTSAAYWVNDEIIYTADYNRGFDILRYTGKP
ncbi:MAG: hypothetical protein QOG54_466 [Actinomycetota bacterium]|jgi:hypothetical protein|nr:hypothetical protein [Actinomycetota bacterium]